MSKQVIKGRVLKKVIIDTDPGIDDFMAIALALQIPDLQVLGLTTVYGNAKLEQTTFNAKKILEYCQTELPVCPGAHNPLLNDWDDVGGKIFHGVDGLGNLNSATEEILKTQLHATQFIIDQAKKYRGELVVLTLGPLTNLALALMLEPKLPTYLKEVVIMGGAVENNGNCTPASEFNIGSDPHAADMVLKSKLKTTLVGLDVTHQVILNSDFFERLAQSKRPFAQALTKASQKYQQSYREFVIDEGVYNHDPSAVAYLAHPELFTLKSGAIRVVTDGIAQGQTLMDLRGTWEVENQWSQTTPSNAATEVDGPRLIQLMQDYLF